MKKTQNAIEVGRRIVSLRIDAGFETASRFARKAGISRAQMSAWENGLRNPTPHSNHRPDTEQTKEAR